MSRVAIVALIGVFILVAVFSSSLGECKKGDETMAVTDYGLIPQFVIPAIDASAHVVTETATFALG
ncbi:hypothetical protein ACFLTL_00800 [Chloroflexota bacterium]